jgi:hypothetical protein
MLLGTRNVTLERHLAVLRETPLPAGSRPLDAAGMLLPLVRRFRGRDAFVYGDARRSIVYTYDTRTGTLVAHAAIIDGVLRP